MKSPLDPETRNLLGNLLGPPGLQASAGEGPDESPDEEETERPTAQPEPTNEAAPAEVEAEPEIAEEPPYTGPERRAQGMLIAEIIVPPSGGPDRGREV